LVSSLWEGSVQQRPMDWGKLVNELVYQYLDADVFDWLKNNASPSRHGQNYHQPVRHWEAKIHAPILAQGFQRTRSAEDATAITEHVAHDRGSATLRRPKYSDS